LAIDIVAAVSAIGGSYLASETAVTAFDGYVATHGSSPVADALHNMGEVFKNNSLSGLWTTFG